ncbi:MAG: formimidoylglutamase [Bacteroidota bacterium]
MRYYFPPTKVYWNGRSDPGYWYQEIAFLPLTEMTSHTADSAAYGILGYACEEGVLRNQGRLGAAAGPNAFRQQLASTAWHQRDISVFDAGDFVCEAGDMEGCQSEYAAGIERLLRKHYFPIGIGGGHDIAFGTYSGVRNYLGPKARLGIINFDAHFDLREPEKNTNSGTPFYQAYQNEKSLGNHFNYLVAGIQEAANTDTLFKTAHESGTHIITNRQLWEREAFETFNEFLQPLDAVYLTIDMDVLASAFAPGVSAASPMGLSPQTLMAYLQPILKSAKVVAIDIAELSPVHDQQNQTAKLAARLVNWILSHLGTILA